MSERLGCVPAILRRIAPCTPPSFFTSFAKLLDVFLVVPDGLTFVYWVLECYIGYGR